MIPRSEHTAAIKQSLRVDAAIRRAAVHAARGETAGPALTARFLAAFSDRLQGAVVSLYWPMRDEIDVRGLIDALAGAGARTALPGVFGVHEPAGDAPVLVPDIVVAPLLAFDVSGNRLGYGGGYYDRTLRDLRARRDIVAAGVGYDEQEFSAVPGDTGDEILDMIITDRRTLRVGENPRIQRDGE